MEYDGEWCAARPERRVATGVWVHFCEDSARLLLVNDEIAHRVRVAQLAQRVGPAPTTQSDGEQQPQHGEPNDPGESGASDDAAAAAKSSPTAAAAKKSSKPKKKKKKKQQHQQQQQMSKKSKKAAKASGSTNLDGADDMVLVSIEEYDRIRRAQRCEHQLGLGRGGVGDNDVTRSAEAAIDEAKAALALGLSAARAAKAAKATDSNGSSAEQEEDDDALGASRGRRRPQKKCDDCGAQNHTLIQDFSSRRVLCASCSTIQSTTKTSNRHRGLRRQRGPRGGKRCRASRRAPRRRRRRKRRRRRRLRREDNAGVEAESESDEDSLNNEVSRHRTSRREGLTDGRRTWRRTTGARQL